jgi:hypothetical protein
MKIAINTSFGGFSYPDNWKEKYSLQEYCWEQERNDPNLIKAIKENKKQAEEFTLEIITIPDNYMYCISEYDGLETVYSAEKLYENGKLYEEEV